jgi:hypothetical protein
MTDEIQPDEQKEKSQNYNSGVLRNYASRFIYTFYGPLSSLQFVGFILKLWDLHFSEVWEGDLDKPVEFYISVFSSSNNCSRETTRELLRIAKELGFVIELERAKNLKRLNKYLLFLPELTEPSTKLLEKEFGKPKMANVHLAENHRRKVKIAISKFNRYKSKMLQNEPGFTAIVKKLHGDTTTTSDALSGDNPVTRDQVDEIPPLHGEQESDKNELSKRQKSRHSLADRTASRRGVSTDEIEFPCDDSLTESEKEALKSYKTDSLLEECKGGGKTPF